MPKLHRLSLVTLATAGCLPFLIAAQPAAAATKEQKAETCKVGADADSLTGAKRDAFMKKCMGAGNYEPQARKDHLKQAKNKKPAAKPAPAPAAEEETEEKAQ